MWCGVLKLSGILFSLEKISVACRVNHIDKWIDWIELNEWANEMNYASDDNGNGSVCLLAANVAFIQQLHEQWMNEKNVRNAFNWFNWLQFLLLLRMECACAFVHRGEMEWEYEKRVRYLPLQTIWIRCKLKVHQRMIQNEWKWMLQQQWVWRMNKKWQLVWVFMIDAILLLWIYHILWHTGCVHFMVISLLEMFQILLINCMFAHLNGWILQ